MSFAPLLTILQLIATTVILFTSIIRASFLVKTNQVRSVKKELYNSKEDSVLQCAQRCTFISKDAILEFDESKMTCLCFSSVDEGSSKEKNATEKNSKVFQIKEIKKYKRSVNHALKKPSTQTSTITDPDAYHPASLANDGNIDTRSETMDKEENEWWKLDMKYVVKIGLIKLMLYDKALKFEFYKQLTIFTRISDSHSWTKCDFFANPTELILETSCQPQRSARFVKIMTYFSSPLNLIEVEVYE